MNTESSPASHQGRSEAHMKRALAADLRVAASIIAIVGLMLGGIIWLEYPYLARAIAFEDSPIAWLQTSALVASATMCLSLATVDAKNGRGGSVWYLTAGLLLVAAIDERFMLHETTARWMLRHFFGGDVTRMGRIGSLPMIGYPIVGALLFAWIWRTARCARWWMLAAILVGAIAITLDIATDAMTEQIMEELCELLAETLFLCTLVIAFRNRDT
jgi:hypothetical protein